MNKTHNLNQILDVSGVVTKLVMQLVHLISESLRIDFIYSFFFSGLSDESRESNLYGSQLRLMDADTALAPNIYISKVVAFIIEQG